MARRQLLVAGTIVLMVVECLLFAYLAIGGWALRDLMLPPGDPQIAERTRTVFANATWLGVNLIGLAGYVFRRRGFGLTVVLIVVALDVLNSLFAAVGFIIRSDNSTAIQWFLLTVVPGAAVVLVLLQRRTLEVPTGE